MFILVELIGSGHCVPLSYRDHTSARANLTKFRVVTAWRRKVVLTARLTIQITAEVEIRSVAFWRGPPIGTLTRSFSGRSDCCLGNRPDHMRRPAPIYLNSCLFDILLSGSGPLEFQKA